MSSGHHCQQVQRHKTRKMLPRAQQRCTRGRCANRARHYHCECPRCVQHHLVHGARGNRVRLPPPLLHLPSDLDGVGPCSHPHAHVVTVRIPNGLQQRLHRCQHTIRRQRSRSGTPVAAKCVSVDVGLALDVLNLVVDIRDGREMMMRNWPLRQGVNKYQAPLVRLHTQRQRRRQGIDACTPNALQNGQQLTEVHGHFLLRHGESSTPKTNVVLHVIDLLKQPRTDCVIRRIRAQNELVGIVRRVVQRRVNESRAQRVKVPLLLVPKLPVHAVLQQV